jgi:hypothetical protein
VMGGAHPFEDADVSRNREFFETYRGGARQTVVWCRPWPSQSSGCTWVTSSGLQLPGEPHVRVPHVQPHSAETAPVRASPLPINYVCFSRFFP